MLRGRSRPQWAVLHPYCEPLQQATASVSVAVWPRQVLQDRVG
jgi:hypothetical protein